MSFKKVWLVVLLLFVVGSVGALNEAAWTLSNTTNLVTYLKMNVSGASLAESSSPGAGGADSYIVYSGLTTKFVPEFFNNTFNASRDDYLIYKNTSQSRAYNRSSFSFGCFFYPVRVSTQYGLMYLNHDVNAQLYVTSSGYLSFLSSHGGTVDTFTTSSPVFTVYNTPYLIIATFNSTHKIIYINNNTFIKNITGLVDAGSAIENSTIGAFYNGNSIFNGTIDECFVYNKSLTIAQMERIYVSTGVLNVSATQLFTNASIQNFNVTNGGMFRNTSSGSVFVTNLSVSNNVMVFAVGNYSKNVTCSSSAFTVTDCVVSGVYDAVLTVGARTGSSAVRSFNSVLNHTGLGGVLYSSSLVDAAVYNVLQGYSYTLNVSKSGYAGNVSNVGVVSSSMTFNASIMPLQIIMSFRDELNRSVLNGTNVSVAIISVNGSQSLYSTSNGSLVLVGSFDPGEYIVRYSAAGYSLREYSFIMSSSDANLTLYLIGSSYYAPGVVSVRGSDGLPVEGYTAVMSRYYGDVSIPGSIQSGVTNVYGEVVMTAEAVTAFYTWLVYDTSNVVVYNQTTPDLLTLDADGLWHKNIVLVATPLEEDSVYSGFGVVFSPSGVLQNGTEYVFSVNLSSSVWDLTTCSFYLLNDSGSVVSGVNNSFCGASGGVGYVVYSTPVVGGGLVGRVNFETGSFSNYYDSRYSVVKYSNDSFTLVNALDDVSRFDKAGFGGWSRFFLSFLIIGIVLFSLASYGTLVGMAEESLLLVEALVIFFSYIDWLHISIVPVWAGQWFVAMLFGLLCVGVIYQKWGANS